LATSRRGYRQNREGDIATVGLDDASHRWPTLDNERRKPQKALPGGFAYTLPRHYFEDTFSAERPPSEKACLPRS
jgi:hypothetical protein